MDPHDRAHAGAHAGQVERLRSWRVRPARDTGVAALFGAMERQLRDQSKRVDTAAVVWERLCPPELLERTRVQGVARAVLTVLAADAAAKYELEQALRAGLEADLLRASRTPIARVRVKLGA
jgi:hypothetical protein